MNLRQLARIVKTLRVGVLKGLPMADQDRDPIDLFGDWIGTAERCGLYLHEAMTLATSTPEGVPSARMVLLKGFDESGFTFFTNYGSRKSGELDSNPHAALVFHWNVLQRQIRITGKVARITQEESAEYFKTRPRGSRIAAWASRQSVVLAQPGDLERAFEEKDRQFRGGEVPVPDFWGGYRLLPDRIEFWQGKANRMHHRLLFRKGESGWLSEWLYP